MKTLVTAAVLTVAALGLTACGESSGVRSSDTGLRGAESACLSAVANQVGVSNVSTISVEDGENATIVLVRVPGAEAPWRCDYGFVDGSPGVLRVMYTAEG